jgi:hypothetical protein
MKERQRKKVHPPQREQRHGREAAYQGRAESPRQAVSQRQVVALERAGRKTV